MVRASKQRLLVLTVRMHKNLAGWLKFASDSVEAKAIFAKAHDPMRELGYEQRLQFVIAGRLHVLAAVR
jgi:hypothetical protein